MFELPSIWNLVISTIVFFMAAKYLHRILEDYGLPKGMVRGALVFSLASLVSWGSGEMVDWSQDKISGSHSTIEASDGVSQLLKLVDQKQSVRQN
jgi:hypothetical protein